MAGWVSGNWPRLTHHTIVLPKLSISHFQSNVSERVDQLFVLKSSVNNIYYIQINKLKELALWDGYNVDCRQLEIHVEFSGRNFKGTFCAFNLDGNVALWVERVRGRSKFGLRKFVTAKEKETQKTLLKLKMSCVYGLVLSPFNLMLLKSSSYRLNKVKN